MCQQGRAYETRLWVSMVGKNAASFENLVKCCFISNQFFQKCTAHLQEGRKPHAGEQPNAFEDWERGGALAAARPTWAPNITCCADQLWLTAHQSQGTFTTSPGIRLTGTTPLLRDLMVSTSVP